jgi:hypothetical protein
MFVLNALSRKPVAFWAVVSVLLIAAGAAGARKIRRDGGTLRGVLARRRQRARERVGAAGMLHVEAPRGAGYVALATFPCVLLALVATPRSYTTKGVYLPALADARWQLWCIAIAVAGAVIGTDFWFGLGTCVRALARDGFSTAIVGVSIVMAAASPLLIIWQVESRPGWLAVLAAQFVWPFAGASLGTNVSERRKRRLSPPAPSSSLASSPAE